MSELWNSLTDEMKTTIGIQLLGLGFLIGMGYMGYRTFSQEVKAVSNRQEEMRGEINNLQRRVDKIKYMQDQLDKIEKNQRIIRKLIRQNMKQNNK